MTVDAAPRSALPRSPHLALVTCGPQLEVALWSPGMAAVSLVRLGGMSPRSTLVMAAVDLVVEDAGLQPPDIAAIVVSRGPGSFTGIRAGLATAAGIAAATGARLLAYDSLLMLAARCGVGGPVWAAQPGRRGEVYARGHIVIADAVPEPSSEIEILPLEIVGQRGPWIAPEGLDLGRARRAAGLRSSAEALLRLAAAGIAGDPLEPLYVEGPPIHRAPGD